MLLRKSSLLDDDVDSLPHNAHNADSLLEQTKCILHKYRLMIINATQRNACKATIFDKQRNVIKSGGGGGDNGQCERWVLEVLVRGG